jgi:protein tyrosine/serine phosphatase
MKDYTITLIDYRTGHFVEFSGLFPEDWDEQDIAEDVMLNVGIEVKED